MSDDLIDEDGGVSTVTAHLDKASSAETIVTVKVTPAGAVTLSGNRLTIAEGETESTITETVTITAKPDNVDELAFKVVTVSGSATNPDDIDTDPAPVTLVILLSEGEEGTIALTETQPQVGRGMTAMLIDPDGGLSIIIWTWERSAANTDPWTKITTGVLSSGAQSSYTPVAIDANQYLRVSATYTDSVGGTSATSETVQVLPLPTVSLELLSSEIAESGAGNSTTVRARLNRPSPAPTSVTVSVPTGAGVTVSGNPLTIIARSLTSTDPVTLTAEDNNVHGPASKAVTVSGSATNTDGITGPASVELTITDDDEPVSVLPPSRSGGVSGGGGGSSGGGGGGACTQDDVHGNSAAQATEIELSAETVGAICPAADVDYFTVTAPGQGLIFVDTTRGVPTRGTIWQDGVVLESGTLGGSGQAERLGARVQAGPVVVAVQGQDGATGVYDIVVTFVRGTLENPGADSFQSGVGVLSGWVCDAETVELELNGMPQEAAYGTERRDTAGVCGDTDNGFGLLFNWNLLGDGEHTVVAFVDGVELGRATVTVTTLGQEFLRDVTGTCEAADFPTLGERVTLVWQQNSQNFVIAGGSPPVGATPGRSSALTGFLENPGHNSFQSGVRVLSGWACDADTVELVIGDTGRQVAAYGTERLDTLDACGDTDNGFGLLFNWNLLGDGEHEVLALVDGEELGRATVRVTTLGAGVSAGGRGRLYG